MATRDEFNTGAEKYQRCGHVDGLGTRRVCRRLKLNPFDARAQQLGIDLVILDTRTLGHSGFYQIFKMSSPHPLPTEAPTAGGGSEFDDLFDYEIGGEDDPFSENYKAPPKTAPDSTTNKAKSGAGLGIDEEVEVTRKPRAPRVKLDEHRFVFTFMKLGCLEGT
jgi:hypothetical protein